MIADSAKRIIDNVQKIIVGKAEEIELVLIALLCEGHVLLEDVPGVGKTTMAKSVSRSLGCLHRNDSPGRGRSVLRAGNGLCPLRPQQEECEGRLLHVVG